MCEPASRIETSGVGEGSATSPPLIVIILSSAACFGSERINSRQRLLNVKGRRVAD